MDGRHAATIRVVASRMVHVWMETETSKNGQAVVSVEGREARLTGKVFGSSWREENGHANGAANDITAPLGSALGPSQVGVSPLTIRPK